MDIRNVLQQKKENKVKKYWLILCILFIIFIIGIIIFLVHREQNKKTYFIGENISILGELQVYNNYPTNTHIISNGIETVGVKSSTLNLNNFTDEKILVNSTITDITKDFPITDISSIIIPEKMIKISNNIYSFAKDLIYFDFSKENELHASKNGNTITIHLQDSPIITIEPFVCSKITPTQDCENLKKHYEDNDFDIFKSYGGDIYYKTNEKTWIAFNDNEIGYLFKTYDDDYLLSISHLINIIDTNFIKENKQDFLTTNCLQAGESISGISSITKTIIDENLIKLETKITDSNGKEINCKLNIDIFNNREIKNKIIN